MVLAEPVGITRRVTRGFETLEIRYFVGGAWFNVIHLATMFKVDVFVLKKDEASQEEMARRERFQISDAPPEGFSWQPLKTWFCTSYIGTS